MEKEFDVGKFYQHAFDWVVNYGPRFLLGMATLILGLWVIRWVLNRLHMGMRKKDVDPTVKPFLLSVIGVILRAILIIGVMQNLGIQLTLFTAIIASFGVAAGLALSGTLQNFASGIIILLLKPFMVGDNIITQGLEGTVTSIQIFYTVVTTFDNRVVIVPNSKLSNEVIINISRKGTRRLDISLKMPNAVSIREARDVINRAIDKETNVLATPERRIGVAELQPDGYVLSVNLWVKSHGFQDTKLSVQEIILQDLIDAGIKLPGL